MGHQVQFRAAEDGQSSRAGHELVQELIVGIHAVLLSPVLLEQLVQRSALGKVRNPPHTSSVHFSWVCCACVIAECQLADEMMTCTFFSFPGSL